MRFDAVVVGRSYEQIVRQIRDAIRDGRLAPGQKLPPERELGESFGVGRGVVREAIKVLAAMGLVEPRQGSGTFVRPEPIPSVERALVLSVQPEEHSLARLFEFRRRLEGLAAHAAARRRDDRQAETILAEAAATERAAETDDGDAFARFDGRFHAAVYAAADNPYLLVSLGAVREMQREVVHLFAGLPGSMAVAAGHHLRVAEAIAARAAEAAEAAMEEHVAYTAAMVAQNLVAAGAPPSSVSPFGASGGGS